MIYTLVKRNQDGEVEAIFSFDSINSFDESWSATVSTQTVEVGFNISDNINIEPPTYDISAVLSSFSLFDLDREIFWDGTTFQSDSQPKQNKHIEARERLIELFKSRSVLTIIESSANSSSEDLDEKEEELKSGYYKEIDSCVITSMSISHPDSATGAFYVSLKLQKVFAALVTTIEMGKGQMTPALVPLKKEEQTVGSNSSTTTGSSGRGGKKGKDDDDLALQSPDAPIYTEKKREGFSQGISWEDGYAQTRPQLHAIQEETRIVEETAAIVTSRKMICSVKRVGNSFTRSCYAV